MESDNSSTRKIKIMRPDNPFNDPYNVGLYSGAAIGFASAYLFAGHLLPHVRRILHAVYNGKSKLALVVREDLKMSKGKIASQCSHATMKMHKNLLSPFTRYGNGKGILSAWEMNGEPTIVLRVAGMKELKEVVDKAKECKVPTFEVHDAGRTEVPEGSLTVLAVGPYPIDVIDRVTGHLRTL